MPKKRKRGRKRVHPVSLSEIPLDRAEAAIRLSGGFLTKAAETLGISLQTMQLMVRKFSTLRDVLTEARYRIVDLAEESLSQLVQDKNVTATIFALKCLGKERGYVEQYKPGSSPDAPLFIRVMPVAPNKGRPRREIEVNVPALSVSTEEVPRRRRQNRVIDITPESEEKEEIVDADSSEIDHKIAQEL